MEIIETGFKDLLIIKPVVYSDSRGYFLESFNAEIFRRSGIIFTPVQDNESSSVKGVIRGLHYQLNPYAQVKLIRVVEGKIYDVVLDLRRNSSTYGKCYGLELDSESKSQFLVPRGFAHGFSVISDTAIIQYKVDNVYNHAAERGIAFNDPSLAIDWKTGGYPAVVSDKDMRNPTFENADNNF